MMIDIIILIFQKEKIIFEREFDFKEREISSKS